MALPGGDTPLTNGDLARIFHEIGDILEVKGEVVFKTVAYHRAADAIARAPFDVADAYGAGDRRPIPGVGQAISDKIAELATTGRMAFHERLRAEIPASLVELLRIPGVGPRTVRVVHDALGIETLDDLRRAAEAGDLRGLKGIGAGTEQRILEGIAQLESRPQRLLLDEAQRLSDDLVAQLEGTSGVSRLVQAGSLRRRRETVGDLDLLVETDRPEAVVERFTQLGGGGAGPGRRPGEGRRHAAARTAGGPDGDAARARPGRTSCTSRGPRHTTSACGASPATAAGACPRRASCAWTRTAADGGGGGPSSGRSPTRRACTASSTWPGSPRSCARTAARWRQRARTGCQR